ncbi:hypothetical protein HMPREF0293_2105 [Corynebacterium glucuronolyticum ATCC 51866]|uniref:Uncharacterized protein n=1 Tax=Corynebacterium glucuronolyticum ATCC 51866 TaxID=548478 RepID=A0ABP2DQT7_9CORY|nr:hypothetical protein HMPREF0293_2105 [Corynebacterium glucuronolyticum ATCC 51866]
MTLTNQPPQYNDDNHAAAFTTSYTTLNPTASLTAYVATQSTQPMAG